MGRPGPSPSGQSNDRKTVAPFGHHIVTMVHLFGQEEKGDLSRHPLCELLKTRDAVMGQDIGYQSDPGFSVAGTGLFHFSPVTTYARPRCLNKGTTQDTRSKRPETPPKTKGGTNPLNVGRKGLNPTLPSKWAKDAGVKNWTSST